MSNNSTTLFICLLLFCAFLMTCIDDSLQKLPVFHVERPYREQPFQFRDSVEISSGLLYRKLLERGYSDLWGLALFDFSQLQSTASFSYDPMLLRCTYEGQRLHLLVTVHRTYQSILDVFAIVPSQQEILQIYPAESGLEITVDLVEKSSFAMDRQQLFKLAIDQEGKIRQD